MDANSETNRLFELRKRLQTEKQKTEKLTEAEELRLRKLKGILSDLKRDKNVQNRQLKKWLTDEEYEGLEQGWQSQKEMRQELAKKPEEIKEYEEKLRKAIFYYNRAEGYSAKGKHKSAKQMRNKSELHFERLLEYLHEIITADYNLTLWFDREVDFSAGGNLSLSPQGVPRIVTSRSLDKGRDGLWMGKSTKREVKIQVIEQAISKLEART